MDNKREIALTFGASADLVGDNRKVLPEGVRRGRAEQAFNGFSPYIKTFAIITAENPMGRTLSSEDNESRNGALASDLGRLQFRSFPICGSDMGKPETPFMIFNIGLGDAKYLSHKFDQKAFVLASVLDSNHAIFKYYQKDFSAKAMVQYGWNKPPYPAKADYRLRDTSWKVDLSASKTNEAYTGRLREFKYTIPFWTIQDFAKMLEERCALFEDYQECLNVSIQLGIDGGGARNRMHCRASIYGNNFHRFWNVPKKTCDERIAGHE